MSLKFNFEPKSRPSNSVPEYQLNLHQILLTISWGTGSNIQIGMQLIIGLFQPVFSVLELTV